MTHYLFLRISDVNQGPETDFKTQWLLSTADGNVMEQGSDTPLSSLNALLPSVPEERKTIILLPGYSVVLNEVLVSAQHLKHIDSAIADAMEEQLAETIEEAHIAHKKVDSTPGKQSGTYLYQVAVIDKTVMQNIASILKSSGFSPHAVINEAALLFNSNQMTIALDTDRCLFSLSSIISSSLEKDTLLIFLEKYFARNTGSLKKLDIVSPEKIDTEQSFLEKLHSLCAQHQIPSHTNAYAGTLIGWLSNQWFSLAPENRPVNLLQGSYRAAASSFSFRGINWKKIIAIFAVWVMAQSLFSVTMAAYLRHKDNIYAQQSEEIYHQLFPQDHKIVDIKLQTEQHLRSMSASGTDDFVPLLNVLASETSLSHRLDITTMRYDGKRKEVVVDVSSDDFAVLEQYKELAVKAGFQLELDSVVREKNEVRCQIKIRKH